MAKKQFKAESRRLLDMMINSIYTHREIFLRELISNASDAIDKLCFLSLTDDKVGLTREDFSIRLTVDNDARTLTVSDNGIGMTAEELEKDLGVIARSGTHAFRSEQDAGELEKADIDVIGRFGVGFYSAFMVASKVTVISRAYGQEKANRWESSGADGYTITECEKDGVGTDVVLTIKEDTDDDRFGDYLTSWKLKELVKKYSDYVRWPIRMEVETTRKIETGETDENGVPKMDWETVMEEQTVNSMVPLWQRSRKEATDEECVAFYKDTFRDSDDPAAVIRVNAEGAVSYRCLLFIAVRAPYDFYTREYRPGLRLYSNGVMIMEQCPDLLPECFRFVRGVVDSPDLSLNISREMLQHDRQLKLIANNLEKKIKSELKKLMDSDRDKYEKFYAAFGVQLKYGVVSDYGNLPEGIHRRHARIPEVHLLRRRRHRRARREAAPDRAGPRPRIRYTLLRSRCGRIRGSDTGRLRREALLQRGFSGSGPGVRRGKGGSGKGRRGQPGSARFCQGAGRRPRGERQALPQTEKPRGLPVLRGRDHIGDGKVFPFHSRFRSRRHEGRTRSGTESGASGGEKAG